MEKHGTRAKLPFFVFAFSTISALAIGWNALVSQSGRMPAPGLADAGTSSTVAIVRSLDEQSTPAPVASAMVLEIQTSLKEMNYYDGVLDGLNGPATHKAVSNYQTRFGLPKTGKADADLLAHLKYSQKLDEATQFTGSTPPRSEDVSQPSAEEIPLPPALPQAGSAVAEEGSLDLALVQQGLSELGYQPGPVDGKMGQKTRIALQSFQRDRGLAVTGELSPKVLSELRKVTGQSSLTSQ
ncbi:MAG: peptidoglycan-binding domain-containing protein [Hyphomicrobiales bacterium]